MHTFMYTGIYTKVGAHTEELQWTLSGLSRFSRGMKITTDYIGTPS